jgi:hypothetical protein
MGIVERTERAVHETQRKFARDDSFIALQKFYAAMQRSGLGLKREYDIPPLDTIGRGLVGRSDGTAFRRTPI